MNEIIDLIVKFIEIIFLKIDSLIGHQILDLFFLSIIINIVLLPLYLLAEKIENKEKMIQEKMKPKIDEFKSVYKGYELHLYTKNVYRLNNYHPIYSLRGLISLVIQIPFFLGAYKYLSHYPGFIGSSFLSIVDLSKPDNLIQVGRVSLNILPVIMTIINLLSGYVYSKQSKFQDKVSIFVIGIVFLIVLYNAPASLLIYWIFNNLFSLVKNLIMANNRKSISKVSVDVK